MLCPFCGEELGKNIPESVRKALGEIQAKDKKFEEEQDAEHALRDSSSLNQLRPHMLLKRDVSNLEQFTFCRLHQLELVIKPEGIRKGYPVEIDFDGLAKRVEKLRDELEDVISGKLHSVFRDIGLQAYKDLGRNRARSSMGVMLRFERTLVSIVNRKLYSNVISLATMVRKALLSS